MNEDWVIIGEKYVLIHSSENVVVPSRGSALIDTALVSESSYMVELLPCQN